MAEKSIPVSVIMPVYNAGVYLKPALESLLEQTLKEIEIIAVDDGSTDGSGQLLAEYAARDKRLKVISLKRSGAAAARNRGIEAACGKWLWFADADDIAAPRSGGKNVPPGRRDRQRHGNLSGKFFRR